MNALRWLFLLACVACVVIVAGNGRWEGQLVSSDQTTWIVDLERAPIWAPPSRPTYAMFLKDFTGVEGFPAEGTPELTIKRILKVDWMVVDLLLYLWPVTVLGGLLYFTTRGKQRDLILHIGLYTGICLTLSAVACLGLWLLFGGWGPPAPELCGGLGLVAGIAAGMDAFKRENATEVVVN